MPRWLKIILLYALVLAVAIAGGIGTYHLTQSLIADALVSLIVGGVGSIFVMKWIMDTATW